MATKTPKKKTTKKTPARKRVTLPALLKISREVMGIDELRPGQEEALRHVLAGKDVLAVMPTGSGKSLLYQLPSLALPGITVVVSPLIALITDQVEKMRERGVAVARIDSTLTVRQKRAMMELVDAPGGKLLLTTPERMSDPEFRKVLSSAAGKVGVSLLVVDEAHCVSQWGHDFRPAYLVLRQGIEELGRPPVLATTATAPPHVRDDILHQLGMPKAKIVTTSFERPNLSFEVIAVPGEDEKKKLLVALLKKLKRPGIVYCATVKAVEQLGEELSRHGIPVATYNGRMVKSERDAMQQRFMEKRSKLVMVATNAFGLGVDKPDIRYVLHYHVPGSLEQYAQEAGRGGRDGLPARCVLLFSPDDVAIQEHFLKGTYPARRQVHAVIEALEAWGRDGRAPTLAELAASSRVGTPRTRTVLALFKEEGWVVEERGGRFHLADPPPAREAVRDRARDYEKRRVADRHRLDALLEYVRAPGCRNHIILAYLGEKLGKSAKCGRCDNCLRSAAEARAAAEEAAALEAVLARKSAEVEGELGEGEGEPAPVKRPRARTRVISLDGPAAAEPVAAPVVIEPEVVEVEPIDRTAAEIAAQESEVQTEITVRKRKKKAKVGDLAKGTFPGAGAPKEPRGHEPRHPAAAESHGQRRKRRRRGKGGHAYDQAAAHASGPAPPSRRPAAPPVAFTSPVLVVAPPTPPQRGSNGTPEAAPAPAHQAPRPPGPIVEYVRRPMKIALAPVASATPHDQPSRRRKKRRGAWNPADERPRPHPGVPPQVAVAPPVSGVPGSGKRRRRRRRRGKGGAAQPGQQQQPPVAAQPFWTPAGDPAQGTPSPGTPGTPSPPGQGKRRRRRRRRRGGGQFQPIQAGAPPTTKAPEPAPSPPSGPPPAEGGS